MADKLYINATVNGFENAFFNMEGTPFLPKAIKRAERTFRSYQSGGDPGYRVIVYRAIPIATLTYVDGKIVADWTLLSPT